MHLKKLLVIFALALSAVAPAAEVTTISMEFADESSAARLAEGRVFEDRNHDGKFDRGLDAPLQGIGVSDGDKVVLSGGDGVYRLPLAATARTIWVSRPADFSVTTDFWHNLDTSVTSVSLQTSAPARYRFDFPMQKSTTPDTPNFRFVQISDVHIGGESDGELFASAIQELNQLTPAAAFVVATGDLVNNGDRVDEFQSYTSGTRQCVVPMFQVFGNHDANRAGDRTRNFHKFLGPDYYSADYGNWHLVFINSVLPSAAQDRWLEQDIGMLGRDKRLLAFQHYAARDQDIAKLEHFGARAVFTGHWHSNKITAHDGGLVSINQPAFLMGGIDGSPASFRIVSIAGDQINSEIRMRDVQKQLWVTYPQESMAGPERLMAAIYDSSVGVREARFRIQEPGQAPLAQGNLVQVSPLSWMAPLDAERLELKGGLPAQFTLRIRATNNRGEQWEQTQRVTHEPQANAAAVKTGEDWPEFMGTAQRTGKSRTPLSPPLQLAWSTPSHGMIDVSSPVLFKERLAIGVKDRDNLIHNGVFVLEPKTGKPVNFVKTDSMVNHSPAFAEDTEDGPGKIYATSVGGTVYTIGAANGEVESTGRVGSVGQQRWIYSSPAVQGHLAVVGNSALLQALNAQFGELRWTNNFGTDWEASYASPTIAGDLIIMGANWLEHDGKPASIYAVDVDHGQLKWINPCEGTHSSVAVNQGRGYAVDTHGVLKVIDLATGADMTTRTVGKGWSLSTPAVDDEIVVAAGASGEVHAFDMVTMRERWIFRSRKGLWNMAPYDKSHAAVFSSPTIAGGFVYIGCSDGRLYALDKNTGDVRWFYDFGVPTLSTPCISGNTLFTAAYDGNVYAFTSSAAK